MLDGHTNTVNVVDSMYFEESKGDSTKKVLSTYLASASIDSTVRIWSRHSENFDLKSSKFTLGQVIHAKASGFALALKFYLLPLSKCNTTYLLNLRLINVF